MGSDAAHLSARPALALGDHPGGGRQPVRRASSPRPARSASRRPPGARSGRCARPRPRGACSPRSTALPFFEEYPTGRPRYVLNGAIFALWGFYDVADTLGRPARRAEWYEGGVEGLASAARPLRHRVLVALRPLSAPRRQRRQLRLPPAPHQPAQGPRPADPRPEFDAVRTRFEGYRTSRVKRARALGAQGRASGCVTPRNRLPRAPVAVEQLGPAATRRPGHGRPLLPRRQRHLGLESGGDHRAAGAVRSRTMLRGRLQADDLHRGRAGRSRREDVRGHLRRRLRVGRRARPSRCWTSSAYRARSSCRPRSPATGSR